MPHKDPNARRIWRNAYQLKRRDKPEVKSAIASWRKKRRLISPEKYRQQCRDYYWKNRARMLARNVAYMLENKERVKVRRAKYRREHPESKRLSEFTRRARSKGVQVDTKKIREFVLAVRSKRRVKCYYGNHFTSGKEAHIDHIIALKNGGAHKVGNLCVSCPTCNMKKGINDLKDWNKEGQQILPM